MQFQKKYLRTFAINQTLFKPNTLESAIDRLKFVQADPIRSPARAQDLVLRHRVIDYRAGDLESKYPELELEEDYLYQYGFLQRKISSLWHPIKPKGLTNFDKKVLMAVKNLGQAHPKQLANEVGSRSVRNWWGGKSQAAKQSLDILHWWGLVRVAKREKGIRIYENVSIPTHKLSFKNRKKELIKTIINLLAPVTEKKLGEALLRIRRVFGESKPLVEEMIKSGELKRENVDGLKYIMPIQDITFETHSGLKLLAPFDPIVWDRNRFEHLWGWVYRFEAYTPKEKRIRGYYAMPVLWNENIIGWANVSRAWPTNTLVNKKGKSLEVDLGFVDSRPKSKKFKKDLELEIDKLKTFLGV